MYLWWNLASSQYNGKRFEIFSPFITRVVVNMKFQGNLADIFQSTRADPILESSISELRTLDINLTINNIKLFIVRFINVLKDLRL